MPLFGDRIPAGSRALRLHCLQHAAFEEPGAVADWAKRQGHEFSVTCLYLGEIPPDPDGFDWLILMGGPMSVHDEEAHPWLRAEKALVRRCLAESRFVLGICLGSQLIAECLGSRVVRNPHREIGWHPVGFHREPGSLFERFPSKADVCHWHGETYDLPPGAILRATSEGCAVQAFELENAVGLQFHLEFRNDEVNQLIHHCGSEIGSGPYEQTPDQLQRGELLHGKAARDLLDLLLDSIADRLN